MRIVIELFDDEERYLRGLMEKRDTVIAEEIHAEWYEVVELLGQRDALEIEIFELLLGDIRAALEVCDE